MRFGKAQFLKFGQLLSPPLCHGEALPPEREAAFISSLLQHLRDDRLCDRLLQPVIVDLFQSFPAESRHCAFGSYILPLQQKSEDELLQGMHHDHRRKIRGPSGRERKSGLDATNFQRLPSCTPEPLKGARFAQATKSIFKTFTTGWRRVTMCCARSSASAGRRWAGRLCRSRAMRVITCREVPPPRWNRRGHQTSALGNHPAFTPLRRGEI